MSRRLFCEISPFAYAVSVKKLRMTRYVKNVFDKEKYAGEKAGKLPHLVFKFNSRMRRTLWDIDAAQQENKVVNLSIAAPETNGTLIKPGEVFSFWRLIGNCSKHKGYREGPHIALGSFTKAAGGGICQLASLIHWLVLHSPLDVIEHYHHDNLDLYPDGDRPMPIGCGATIVYNYKDYRFKNNTESTFQIISYADETHLCGELRTSNPQRYDYRVSEEDVHFVNINGSYYKKNKIARRMIDKKTGNELENKIIAETNAKVMYDERFIDKNLIRQQIQ